MCDCMVVIIFFFNAEAGIRGLVRSRGLVELFKRQVQQRRRLILRRSTYQRARRTRTDCTDRRIAGATCAVLGILGGYAMARRRYRRRRDVVLLATRSYRRVRRRWVYFARRSNGRRYYVHLSALCRTGRIPRKRNRRRHGRRVVGLRRVDDCDRR